ncbi:DUF4105 domain-containing protein [uncultured Winogradskyella sp.]|uniref:lipoprotein N-acyltransferase Lnb domain-containing protein n=1 Tax=uncultured Winogradskyella sp. TaxID=395353 RepID=UPI0026303FDA|nr:DUF4105 domain-containing protein [uncultured Winogradskyella sp.]
MQIKLRLSFYLILFISFFSFGQGFKLSENARISVLTFGPGHSLNDAFGHSAFRINDPTKGLDLVYGYGEYDFDAPNFYLKFARGKLNYLISRHNYSDVYYHYSSYDRSISEQILNLSFLEKQKLFSALENNYKPENRRYLYDFFYDNCATRIRDVTQSNTASTINFTAPNKLKNSSFRDLIYEHVPKNSWGSLGIDIALGSLIDREVSAREYMFLPKYISRFFADATMGNGKKLAQQKTILYKEKETKKSSNGFLSPLVILGVLGFLILYLTYKDYTSNKRTKWLDTLLLFCTGSIGVLLLLLWFATDHTATNYNYNLLWAFPLNLILIRPLLMVKVKNWVRAFLKFLMISLCLMTLHWIIGVQVFAVGLIPILIALIVRYLFILQHITTK